MKLTEEGTVIFRGSEEGYFVDCYAEMLSESTESVTIGPFKKGSDECDLESLLKTLTLMGELFPDDLMYMDDYIHIPGFLGWFETGYETADALYSQYPDVRIDFEDYRAVANKAAKYGAEWPFDPATGYENPARYNGYQVYYVDVEGAKTRISVEF